MSKEIVEKIKSVSWHSDWSGPIPLIDICMAPGIYTLGFEKLFGCGFDSILVTFKNGIAAGKFAEMEYENFGKRAAIMMSDEKFAKEFVNEFMEIADEIFVKINVDPETFLKNLASMKPLYANYGAHSEAAKIAFNYLSDDYLEIKKSLERARKYCENFYHDNAKAYEKLAEKISQQVDIEKQYILMMTNDELLNYAATKNLPEENILVARYLNSGVYWNKGEMFFLDSKEVDELEEFWTKHHGGKGLKGICAYAGKIKGKCRVILDFRGATLEKGDILVTGMTTPDFVPLMKNAAAIITDGGGMLCHAAIVSRELKTPCVIGTKIATKILKDGDLVEVDANSGIIKIH